MSGFLMSHKKRVLLSVFFVLIATVRMADAQVPQGFGSTPTFDEEFNGTSLDLSVWSHRNPGVRDSCYNDPSAVSVANGYARIRIYTAKDAHGVTTNYCAAITTQNSFLLRYGYWEAAVRLHYEPGMQSSFWIQSPVIEQIIGNPQQGGVEMDVFEHTSSKTSAIAFDHALHWNGYKPGFHKSIAHNDVWKGLDDGKFHTFGLAWTPGSVTFYIDGQESWQLSASDAAISGIAEYIILDTELPRAIDIPAGGYGPLGAYTNAFLDIDYVRVYPYRKDNVGGAVLIPMQ